jgi:selenocysteine lyase/cysteine desulfurase
MDVTTIRKDFPSSTVTCTAVPSCTSTRGDLAEAACGHRGDEPVYEECNANVHRGVHALAEERPSSTSPRGTRIARFVGADPRGAGVHPQRDRGDQPLAYSYARHRLGEGDILLSTQMEHHANIVPWQLVPPEAGFDLRYVPSPPGASSTWPRSTRSSPRVG